MFIYTSYFVTQTVKEMSNTGSGSDAIKVFCASAQTFLSEIGIFIVSAVEYLEHWYSLVPLPWFVLKAQEVFPPVLLDHHCKHHCVWRTHIISFYYNENSFELSERVWAWTPKVDGLYFKNWWARWMLGSYRNMTCFFYTYLFVWQCRVFVAARGIFDFHCDMRDL